MEKGSAPFFVSVKKRALTPFPTDPRHGYFLTIAQLYDGNNDNDMKSKAIFLVRSMQKPEPANTGLFGF